MNVVEMNGIYTLYGEGMNTYDKLPAKFYTVKFNKMTGFFLETHLPIEVSEKIYGVHQSKVDKVMNSFDTFERNLGVILSGAKGIGKSLCAKLLAIESVKRGLPLIIVNNYIPGIADYISSIDQEVVVLFDEFDKTFFAGNDSRDSREDPQSEMLTLFDGLSRGKKLFIVTCNELNNLNNYLVNRPGRFHYHFRFDYPTNEEIREYLEDKMNSAYYGEIDKVITFSRKVPLNYDCLRAIAFELSTGSKFEDAIKDLNIVNVTRESYNVVVYFKDGTKASRQGTMIDMFDDDDITVRLDDKEGYPFNIIFNPGKTTYDVGKGGIVANSKDVNLDWFDSYYNDDEEDSKRLKERKAREVEFVLIRHCAGKSLHYVV